MLSRVAHNDTTPTACDARLVGYGTALVSDSRFALTEGELRQGAYRAQKRALQLIRRFPYLPFTAAIRKCAQVYLDENLIPVERPGDAIQLAFATIHEIDYLLTWNYAHLANLDSQRKLHKVNRRLGWETPSLVSPETIPRRSLGQIIERGHDAIDNE